MLRILGPTWNQLFRLHPHLSGAEGATGRKALPLNSLLPPSAHSQLHGESPDHLSILAQPMGPQKAVGTCMHLTLCSWKSGQDELLGSQT